MEGELERMYGLLLQYVAGEEEKGCEDEYCRSSIKDPRSGERGGLGWGSLPTPEEMATEI